MSADPAAISPTPAPAPSLAPAPGTYWVKQLVALSQRAPALAGAIAPLAVHIAWLAAPALRDGTMANARWLLGADSSLRARKRLAKRVIRNFYLFICEMGALAGSRGSPERLASMVREVRGREHFDAAQAMGRGVIIVTAHLGSFEAGIASLRGLAKRVHVVFKRDELEGFERLRSLQRERLGAVEAPVDEGWPMWLRLRESLAAGEVVLLQGDRVMPGQSGVRVPMMDGHVEFPSGPIKLALATGAPILPVFSVRSSGKGSGGLLQIIDEPIIVEGAGGAERGEVHPAMLRLAGVIERRVREYPDQWLMLHRVWCEDRPREDGPRAKTT